jgi:hypothetical protein
MFDHPLRRHPFRISILFVLVLSLAWWQGWFGSAVPFRSVAHDINLGREYNQYTSRDPSIFLVKSSSDAGALGKFLQLHTQRDVPSPIITQLNSIDYDQEFGVLVLQGTSGGSSGVTVQGVRRQWKRLLIDARFTVPGWGTAQQAIVTDAYDLIAIPKAPFDGTYLSVEVWDSWRSVASTAGQIGEPPRPPASPTMPPVLP